MDNISTKKRMTNDAFLFAVSVVLLCLPALVNGSPIVYNDTVSYYKGGVAAVAKIDAIFHPARTVAADDVLSAARGVRSAYYSLFEFILTSIGSLWLVILVQAAIVAALLRLLLRLMYPKGPVWQEMMVVVLLTTCTTASWAISFAMPDIFNGVLGLAVITAALFWDRLNILQRISIFLVISASCVVHLTDLLTAVGLLAVAALIRWRPWAYLTLSCAVGASVVALFAVGVVGFKEWSIAPQSPPFLMARIIADGPGRLYLQNHCPQLNWAICNHLDRLNESADDFLWHENGVYSAPSVSPDERAALRAEDRKLFVAAATEYPWSTIRHVLLNLTEQLGDFTLRDFAVPSGATYAGSELKIRLPEHEVEPLWQRIWAYVIYAVVLGSMVFLMQLKLRGRLTKDETDFFILAMATVWLAALAGALSDVAPRYEARAIWLIPLTAALVATARIWGSDSACRRRQSLPRSVLRTQDRTEGMTPKQG